MHINLREFVDLSLDYCLHVFVCFQLLLHVCVGLQIRCTAKQGTLSQ